MRIDTTLPWRLGALTALVSAKSGLGRTALMKYLYFLQAVREVDLGYNFTMYAYGPFDSAVLGDLTLVSMWGGVKSTPVQYPGGCGYRLEPDPKEDPSVKKLTRQFLSKHQEDLDWVLETFGDRDASGLELDSTIIYIDHETAKVSKSLDEDTLVERVKRIKPQFKKQEIEERIDYLLEKEALLVTKA